MLLVSIFLLSLAAFAQEGRGGRHMPSVDDQTNEIKKAVNLSDDQTSKVHDILQAQRDKMQQLFQDSSVSREDRRSQMQALREDSDTQIRALLSDDQKKSYDNYLQHRRNEMRERRQGGGNDSQPPQ